MHAGQPPSSRVLFLFLLRFFLPHDVLTHFASYHSFLTRVLLIDPLQAVDLHGIVRKPPLSEEEKDQKSRSLIKAISSTMKKNVDENDLRKGVVRGEKRQEQQQQQQKSSHDERPEYNEDEVPPLV